jgi:hypothetical protein
MDLIITTPGMATNIWKDTLEEINTPEQYIEPVKMHFIDKGANTPLQFIAQLITVLFTHDGSPIDENAFKILLRRFKDHPNAQHPNAQVQRHIRRTLFALIAHTDVQLRIDMSGYGIDVSEFEKFEDYLDALDARPGGNKKKKSAKRKSSKKRSTRSKKRVSSA